MASAQLLRFCRGDEQMPIYEYTCPACGHAFEKMQKVSDPAPGCPSCGAVQVHKQVSRTSFQLKGGGWYVTDYANNTAKATRNGDAKADATATESGAATTAESKPAATTESKPAADKPTAA
jgi:putative FmdB family regulatory protein